MAFDLKYLGHSAFEIKINNEESILIDPYFADRNLQNNIPEISKLINNKVTDIFVTHGHSDHLGNAIEISQLVRVKITAMFELANYCIRKGATATGINFGTWLDYDWGRARFLPALHSNSTPEGTPAGLAAGILFDINGIKLYHAGDTALFSDLKMVREFKPDIALLPVGGCYTMGIEEAAIAADWIGADIVVPIHYNTFRQIEVDIVKFKLHMDSQMRQCHIMRKYDILHF